MTRCQPTISVVKTSSGAFRRPRALLRRKKMNSRLYMHSKRFIELSLLLCIATARADGSADVSLRGDTPGFVGVPNDGTVVIPDLLGNNLLDTLSNIIENHNV